MTKDALRALLQGGSELSWIFGNLVLGLLMVVSVFIPALLQERFGFGNRIASTFWRRTFLITVSVVLLFVSSGMLDIFRRGGCVARVGDACTQAYHPEELYDE